MKKKIFTVSLALGMILLISGCQTVQVKPWERNILAKPEMSLSDPLTDSLEDHTYFSKEASSGGRGFGGGGCGCN